MLWEWPVKVKEAENILLDDLQPEQNKLLEQIQSYIDSQIDLAVVLCIKANELARHTYKIIFVLGALALPLCGLIAIYTIHNQRKAGTERERLIAELQDALAQVKTLRGLIPICATCKKIRDDRGLWRQIESYIQEHSDADFSHGICPDCAKKALAELDEALPEK